MYDADTLIETIDKDGLLCVHPFHEGRFGEIEIDGTQVSDLLEALSTAINWVRVGDKTMRFNDKVFNIGRKVYKYGSDFGNGKVIDILARVDESQLLSLRIVEEWRDLHTEVITQVTRQVTYCGRYSIEWAEGEST